MITAATQQLTRLLDLYRTVFPAWSFPYLTLGIAAAFQSFAWMSGPIFMSKLSLIPRIIALWFLALGEYSFMAPTMNAGVEVLNMSEPLLVVVYQVMTLFVFMLINVFVFKRPFKAKYALSFLLISIAVYIAYL